MKKFYSLILLFLCALSASALSTADIAGEYHWSFYNYIGGVGGTSQDIAIAPVDGDDALVSIAMPELGIEFAATFDADAATVTIAPDLMVASVPGVGDIHIYMQRWNSSWTGFDDFLDLPIVATYDAGSKTFSIPYNDLLAVGVHGLDPLLLAENNRFEYFKRYVVEEDTDTYEDFGTAEFLDGLMVPFFKLNQRDPQYTYEVRVEKNLDHEGIYRLVDPFKDESHVLQQSGINESDRPGYVKFSIENPDYPMLIPTYSGVTMEEWGGDIYFYDINTKYVEFEGMAADEVLAFYGMMSGLPGLSTFDAETGTLTIPTPYIGLIGDMSQSFNWLDDQKVNIDMYTRIRLKEYSGVQSIYADSADAAPVYYNMQGIRVANPGHGLYIRVSGSHTQKIIR